MSEKDKKDHEIIDLETVEIEKDVLSLVSEDMCRRIPFIPISRSGEFITVAMPDPTDVNTIEDIQFVTNMKLKPVLASKEDITKALDKHLESQISPSSDKDIITTIEESSTEESEDFSKSVEQSEEAPVVKLVNSILCDAVKKNASHIHLDPLENSMRVRYRVDGVLRDVIKIPPQMKNSLNSRMKIISNLDISERRLPQDGRLEIKFDGKTYETVLATLPTLHGERIVIKLLQSTNKLMDIEELGFSIDDLTRFEHAIGQQSGLILVTGPRESGKTTTIYAALNYLNTSEINILTIENPINVDLEGIGQTQIREEIGYNYVSALRSMMRQNPDIIMVQEICDLKTAEKIIQVTLDGYLILSSMDVDDSPAALLALLELGISPSMINSSVRFVLSQRLVRKVCESCKLESTLTKENLDIIKDIDPLLKTGESSEKDKIYSGQGCDQCGQTGYRGRIPISETLILTPKIKQALLNKVSHHELRKTAIDEGMTTMAQDALKKVKKGETTLDECLRIFSLFL
jgi:type IV pilus assembly protein PilB